MSVSSRGPEANFFSEYRESIIAHGRFVGLFLQGVAPQVAGTGAAMVGKPGGRVSAWKRLPGGNWQGFFCTEGRWAGGVRNNKTLSALGRWFGFGLDQIFSGLIGSAGCKVPGLVWFIPQR